MGGLKHFSLSTFKKEIIPNLGQLPRYPGMLDASLTDKSSAKFIPDFNDLVEHYAPKQLGTSESKLAPIPAQVWSGQTWLMFP